MSTTTGAGAACTCKCWRNTARGRRWRNVLHHKRWYGRLRGNRENDRCCCVLHWSGIKKLGLLQHIRESARTMSTPISAIVGADPKNLLVPHIAYCTALERRKPICGCCKASGIPSRFITTVTIIIGACRDICLGSMLRRNTPPLYKSTPFTVIVSGWEAKLYCGCA